MYVTAKINRKDINSLNHIIEVGKNDDLEAFSNSSDEVQEKVYKASILIGLSNLIEEDFLENIPLTLRHKLVVNSEGTVDLDYFLEEVARRGKKDGITNDESYDQADEEFIEEETNIKKVRKKILTFGVQSYEPETYKVHISISFGTKFLTLASEKQEEINNLILRIEGKKLKFNVLYDFYKALRLFNLTRVEESELKTFRTLYMNASYVFPQFGKLPEEKRAHILTKYRYMKNEYEVARRLFLEEIWRKGLNSEFVDIEGKVWKLEMENIEAEYVKAIKPGVIPNPAEKKAKKNSQPKPIYIRATDKYLIHPNDVKSMEKRMSEERKLAKEGFVPNRKNLCWAGYARDADGVKVRFTSAASDFWCYLVE